MAAGACAVAAAGYFAPGWNKYAIFGGIVAGGAGYFWKELVK